MLDTFGTSRLTIYRAHGVTLSGALGEFAAYPAAKVFKIHNLSDVDATLLEPARYVFPFWSENILLTFQAALHTA
jgi:hypothetical protein